jgi:hypothetical protein
MTGIPRPEEIDLMDKFLNVKFENKEMYLTDDWYVTEYDLNHSTVSRVINLIGEYADRLDFARTQIVDNKHFIAKFKEPEIIDFIKNGGFKAYFTELNKENEILEEYRSNVINNAKPTNWYKKTEFIVSTTIASIALLVPFVTRHLDKIEQNELMKKSEIQAKVDSVYKASQNYSDSLFLANTSTDTENDTLKE